jgi:hypothetical protein
MDMIGHNSGTPAHQLNAAIAGLGLALQDARTNQRAGKEAMVIVARHLLAVDAATADNEELSDAQIKAAGIVLTTDLLTSAYERAWARWMARGGVLRFAQGKEPNEINDLEAGSLNPIEARFLTGRKFAKLTTYTSINSAFTRECKAEIRRAFDGGEGALTLDDVRSTYADTLFKADTIDGWVAEEEYRRSAEYARLQNIKKAWAIRIEEALEEAKTNALALDRLEEQVKKQLAQVHALAAQKRAEQEAKEKAANLTAHQRRTLAVAQGSENADDFRQVTDEDF